MMLREFMLDTEVELTCLWKALEEVDDTLTLLKAELAALKARLDNPPKISYARKEWQPPSRPAPHYDDVFVKGTKWLDDLVGERRGDE